MKTGYKIVRPDFTSACDEDLVKYLPDPSAPLPGLWITVPGNGAYVSRDGEGLYCGGVPKDWRCVKLAVEEELDNQGVPGVSNYRRVRVIEIMAEFPAATTVGDVVAFQGATVNLPSATTVGDVVDFQGATVNLPSATTVGHVCASPGATVNLPDATTVGDVVAYEGATVNLPAATTVGDVVAFEGATVNLPAATTVGDVRAFQGATVNLPSATTVGDVVAYEDATVNLADELGAP